MKMPISKIKFFAQRKFLFIAMPLAFLSIGIGIGIHHTSVANAASCSKAWGTIVANPDLGLKSRQGYFSNCAQVSSWGERSFVITTGVMTSTTSIGASAASQSNAKASFISQIETYYKKTSGANYARNALGAAFVIQSMRGLGGGASSNPNAAALADWEARINNPAVVMSISGTAASGCPTSADNLAEYRPLISGATYAPSVNGHNAGGDVAFDALSSVTGGGNCRSIVFKVGGKVVYQLREICANAYGTVSKGLPDSPYKLTPSISTDQTVVEPGADVQVSPAVNNVGGGPSSGTTWQISTFTLPSSAAIPGANNGAAAPCTHLASVGAIGCTVEGGTTPDGSTGVGIYANGSPASFKPSSGADWGVKTRTVSMTVGMRICYVLSVKDVSSTDTNWGNSAASCVLIAKKPKVQILGDDLRVGAAFVGSTPPASSDILTNITIKDNKSYGSWDEYGVAASGNVTGFASGSALAGGLACVGSTCQTNTLTFTNAAAPIGHYVSSTSIPDVASSFPISASTPQYSNLSDTALQRVETGTGNITVSGGTILKGQWLVINAPTATVTITGDINYDPAALTSISDIPQLVIIANQINIAGNVKNVDAWLIASGASGIINTCSDVPVVAPLTTSICNNTLLVNGPVMAKQLYLRRTAGAAIGDPAETFNLRPDAYLWATFQASKSARLETTYSQELPPRF